MSFSWCAEELGALSAEGLRRHPVTVSSPPGPEISAGGARVLALCSNDYLALAGHPRVRQAAAQAAQWWGAGSGASRLVCGTTELHRRLERALAAFKGCEDAIAFSSGYLANTGTIAALAGKADAVFSDEANHASIIDGCRLSGARVVVYRHGDAGDLERALGSLAARRRLVVTDSVFSMGGDLAPLGEIASVAERHEAMLLVDEAHATGLLGPGGAGAVGAARLPGAVLVMATLSKALGSAGGAVAGPAAAVEYLRNRARSYVFDTAPAPAAIGAALESLRIVAAEPQRRARVLEAAAHLAAGLAELGYAVRRPAAAIVPVMVGGAEEAVALSARLLEEGVLAPAIRPPSVPAGTARLRLTVTAAHTDAHLAAALDAFRRVRPPAGGRPDAGTRAPASLGAPRRAAPVDVRIRRAGGAFVTGTGTGVGKTVVVTALARAWAAAGLEVGALKPAQTGAEGGADDMAFVRAAAGLPPGATRTPFVLGPPLAPAVAARLAGTTLAVEDVASAFEDLRTRCDAVVVEGAGGLLVPFDGHTTMAGLAVALGLPLVVVAAPGLGTLNHTALTVQAARAAGLEVVGIVVSGFPAEPGLAETTNLAELERLAGAELQGVVPELPGLDVDRLRIPEPFDPGPWLAPALGGTFDRTAFLERWEPSRVPA